MASYDLDKTLINFATGNQNAAYTLRHAVEGLQIFGGIGSGKSSGSGRMMAQRFLREGYGGLVLTVKPDEKDAWVEYCKKENRFNDLIIIEPGCPHYFNFLEYEALKATDKQGLTENLVDLLKTVIRAGESKDSGKSDDSFWESALDMLIFNVIDLCKLAYGSPSIEKMFEIVQTIPKQEKSDPNGNTGNKKDSLKAFKEAMEIAHADINSKVAAWRGSMDAETHIKYDNDPALFLKDLYIRYPEARLYKYVRQFFIENYKNLNDKTRSIIEFIFSGFLFRLLREPVFSMFCDNKSTVSPEDCLNGKIILLNIPVKTYHKIGRDCQIMFKYIWQRAMEARNIKENDRPVFLYADEAQHFLHEHDAEFQATARSSRICTVYISQNLANYYAYMGGEKSNHKVKSFLGTLATKIFHANADIDTNQYSSELIGDALQTNPTFQITVGKEFSQSKSVGVVTERRIKPEQFVRLKTGGDNNKGIIEAYIHRQGSPIFDNKNFELVSFNQNRM